jgi:hypothetical protein
MTYTGRQEGYKNSLGTDLARDGLASDEFQTIPISVNVASRDWGNPDGSTILRPYLAMGFDTSTGRYAPYNSAAHAVATVVILAEEVRDLDQATAEVNSVAFIAAIFKKNTIVVANQTPAWTSVQRIIIRDNTSI